MISSTVKRRMAGLMAIFMLSALTLGCDDDYRDPPPPPPHHGHNGPPPPPHHGHNGSPPPPPPGHGPHHHGPHIAHRSSLVGAYEAQAINETAMGKASSFSVDVLEHEDGSLYLKGPYGKEYAVSYNEETGMGSVANGEISMKDAGAFVYCDKDGGMWLVQKK